ncbi:MAG: carboxypeptidase-like regulatory domain-containing protein [Bacteroidota bacterium]
MNIHLKFTVFFIGLMFLFESQLAAQNEFVGVVVNDKGQPIEFATVYLGKLSCGTYTNENGKFSFICQESMDSTTDLVISHLGYQSERIKIQKYQQNDTITLIPQEFNLNLVEVVSDKSMKMEDVTLDYSIKNPYFYYQSYVESNHQVASRIANENKVTGYINEIAFKVGKSASIAIPMRMYFYDLNEECQCPGNLLHSREVLVRIKSGKNKVALSNYKIKTPENDFYVSFEWLRSSNKNAKEHDFSIGMIPYESKYPMLERKGGMEWQKLDGMSKSRILTKIKVSTGKR